MKIEKPIVLLKRNHYIKCFCFIQNVANKNTNIYKLGPFQDQITAPNNGPEVVLDNLGKHEVWGRQGTDPDGSGMLLSLRDNMEEFSKIIQRRRQYYLIVRAGRNLEHRHPDELTDDLRINILNNLEISKK